MSINKQLNKFIIIIILLQVILIDKIYTQPRIKNIYIERKEVFDSLQRDWFFAGNLANAFHTLTKRYIIEDELLFQEGDLLDNELIYETERNLRATNLFISANIEVDTLDEDNVNLWVVTQDKWSLKPSIIIGTGGEESVLGGKLVEDNLFGTGTYIQVEGLYRTENNIGWQGLGILSQRRLFRSEISFEGSLQSNKFRTDQSINLFQPYRTLSTEYSYGLKGVNSFGSDFLFKDNSSQLMPFHERRLYGWFSKAWFRKDRLFATAAIQLEDVKRLSPDFRRAYDNSGQFLLAFSSVSEDYIETSCLNGYLTEDLPIGGWGTAVLGKIFPAFSNGGESFYYVGAQGEKSWLTGNLYLFGQLTGASSFAGSKAYYTYQEFFGLGFWRITPYLILAARFREQASWNWDALRQLILDNNAGLRGYKANAMAGDNRIIANFELRFFPDIPIWIVNLSGVLFYDVGTVWRHSTQFYQTQWHHSIGFGLRIHNMKAGSNKSLLRIDFAFNFDEGKFAEIIFTSDQLFSVFKKHIFKLPEVFGLEFDYE